MFFSSDDRDLSACLPNVERLEERLMLTTLVGGDTFGFYDANGVYTEVILKGDIIVELMATQVNTIDSTLLMAGTPGVLQRSDSRVLGPVYDGFDLLDLRVLPEDGLRLLGGFNGEKGVLLIGPTGITDASTDPVVGGFGSVGYQVDGLADVIDIQGLASDDLSQGGQTFGFNLLELADILDPDDPDGEDVMNVSTVQLLQIDATTGDATVVAYLHDELPTDDDGDSIVEEIQAADFHPYAGTPDDGRLYFVALCDYDDGPLNQLYSVDVGAGSEVAVTASVRFEGTIDDDDLDEETVTSIAFEQNADDPVRLYTFWENEDLGELFVYDIAGGAIHADYPVLSIGYSEGEGEFESITEITGLEFVYDDSEEVEDVIYATYSAGAESELLMIRLVDGMTFWIGNLPDPEDVLPDSPAPQRGLDIQGLAWNPVLRNPFTGRWGALIATDATSDELMFIDHRIRFDQADVFNIMITQASDDASLLISQATDPRAPTLPAAMQLSPFGGASPALSVMPDQLAWTYGGSELEFAGGVGGVFIGAVTTNFIDDDFDEYEENRPMIFGNIGDELATRPVMMDTTIGGGNTSAGLEVLASLLEYYVDADAMADRLVGHNLDDIQNMAVRRDGYIAVVDSDRVDSFGEVIDADQIAVIDPLTGWVLDGSFPVNVTNGGAGVSVGAMDYGDLDSDGTEELYAIVNGAPWDPDAASVFGTLNPVTGVFNELGALPIGGSVLAMAFSPQGELFVVAGNTLYEVDPNNPGDISAVGPLGWVNSDGDLIPSLIPSMDFDENSILFGHDWYYGSLVSINTTTAALGELTVTDQGTLRPTVGEISYDFINDRFLAIDNATSYGVLLEGEASAVDPDEPSIDARVRDSAVLMTMLGTETDSPAPQSLDKILIGGTITGRVDIAGSVDTFYAGWILTGNTSGTLLETGANNDVIDPIVTNYGQLGAHIGNLDHNFVVDGDLRNLISYASMGGELFTGADNPGIYLTGMTIEVGGKIGWVHSYAGDILAEISAGNEEYVGNWEWLDRPQVEVEMGLARIFDDSTPSLLLSDDAAFENFAMQWLVNDDIARPQFLSSLRSGRLDWPDLIQVRGNLIYADPIDYYAVALTAGQTIKVQLATDPFGITDLAVFDPDGRIILTDLSDIDQQAINSKPGVFTTTQPGIYRFAVSGYGEWYDLMIEGAGDLGVGAVTAGVIPDVFSVGHLPDAFRFIYSPVIAPMVDSGAGSIGAIVAGAQLVMPGDPLSMIRSPIPNVSAGSADVRAVVAGSIAGAVWLDVPSGDVGLVWQTPFSPYSLSGGTFVWIDTGGDVQVIDSASGLYTYINAAGGLGMIRALDMAAGPSVINLNTDGFGNDGIIDLIDVEYDLGNFVFGGPQITTGLGGNVRYIRAGGRVFVDSMFGNLANGARYQLPTGESVTLRDDSGGYVTLEPVADEIDLLTLQPVNEATLDYWFYPIRGSGGGVIIDVRSTGSIRVTADNHNNGAPVEIGRIEVDGDGRAVVADPVTYELSMAANPDPATELNLVVDIIGSDRVDVFEVAGGHWESTLSPWEPHTGSFDVDSNFTYIRNTTGGDLVNIIATTIGSLYSDGAIGMGDHFATPATLDPIALGGNYDPVDPWGAAGADNAIRNARILAGEWYRLVANRRGDGNLGLSVFQEQTLGVIAEQIMSVRSKGALGNFFIFDATGSNNLLGSPPALEDGNIGSMEANFGDPVNHADGRFDGIAAPIYVTGELTYLNIGEGLAPTGRGDFAQSGVFAEAWGFSTSRGVIMEITNQGMGSDIRGDVFGMGGIHLIHLTGGGSILDADIQTSVLSDHFEWEGVSGSPKLAVVGGVNFWPDMGRIIVEGGGGIIGSNFAANNIDEITVHGFGLFNSHIEVWDYAASPPPDDDPIWDDPTWVWESHVGTIRAGGYGIRDVDIIAGNFLGGVYASGHGDLVSTLDYSPTVRFSEFNDVDPLFGQPLTALNDLHGFLGTSVLVTDAVEGIIENVHAYGQFDLGHVRGYQILETANNRGLETQFDFGNSIGSIITDDLINGLGVTTGSLKTFRPGNDVYSLDMVIAGRINTITINGDLGGNSSITANGPNARIGKLIVHGDMDGDLAARGIIGTLTVDGDLSGNVSAVGTNRDRYALKQMTLGGSLLRGSIDISGNVGKILIGGSMGEPGDFLHVDGNLNNLIVGADRMADGAIVDLELSVAGDVKTMIVDGQIANRVFVGGSINQMRVRADAATVGGNLIGDDITILGKAQTIEIVGGILVGDIVVGLDLSVLRVINGDIGDTGSVSSSVGDIGLVEVRNGDMLGQVTARNGVIKSFRVTGSDLGAASVIHAQNLLSVQIDGDMLSGAQVIVDEELSNFKIGGNVEAGASVMAAEAKALTIGGDWLGLLDLGARAKGTTIQIGGDLDGDATNRIVSLSDLKMTVKGSVLPGATISIAAADLNSLTVGGSLGGGVLVDGRGGTIRAASMNGAVLTFGLDLQSLNVTGAADNSLVQVGISRGNDGQFADGATVQADLGETGRLADLRQLSVGGMMSNSVVASAGDVGKTAVKGGMTSSSISSGLNLGSEAVADVLADATPLADAAEQNAARSGNDRQLLRGDIASVVIGGAGLVASDLTAGVDAGPDGDFAAAADNGVVSSLTGGASRIGMAQVTGDGDSTILADAGIGSPRRSGPPTAGLVDADVDYAIADIATVNPADLVGTALNGLPVTYMTSGGHMVTVTVKGSGTVAVYDEAGGDTDDTIDSLVIEGASNKTKITVAATTPGAVSVGRIVTADDVQVGSLIFDGAIVGDATAEADLVLDGGIGTLVVGQIGGAGNWSGRIGGDVGRLAMGTQSSGNLRVGGHVSTMVIESGDNLGLVQPGGVVLNENILAITAGSTGQVWVYDDGTHEVYLATNPATAQTVTDLLDGGALTLNAMDFTVPGDALYAVTTTLSFGPSVQIGEPSGGGLVLAGLAVSPTTGQVVAVANVGGQDWLGEFDPASGWFVPIGAIRDIFSNTYDGHVQTIAFNEFGVLVALVSDRDGTGTASDAGDGVAMVIVETVDTDEDGFVRATSPNSVVMPGEYLDGGGLTDVFTSMAVDGTGTIYAIRDNGGDELVTLAYDGTVTSVGAVQVNGAGSQIIGMGSDGAGNLVALNQTVGGDALIAIDVATPGASTELTNGGIYTTGRDAFAVGVTTDGPVSYAYDADGDPAGPIFYTNPGVAPVLGTIDTDTGDFERIRRSLVADANGTPLSAAIVDLAIDNAASGDAFVLTDDGQLFRYDTVDGSLIDAIGVVMMGSNEMSVTAIDFDDATGELIGIESLTNSVVTIDPDTGVAVSRTEQGSVDATSVTMLTGDVSTGEFVAFSQDSYSLVNLGGANQAGMAQISAGSIGNLQIGGGSGYRARLAVTGAGLSSVVIDGLFDGSISVNTDLGKLSHRNGNFAGSVLVGGDMKSASVIGNMLAGSQISVLGQVGSFKQTGGEFAGALLANAIGSAKVGGDGLAVADVSAADLQLARIDVATLVNNLAVSGDFSGEVEVGSAGKLSFGALTAAAAVGVAGDAVGLKVTGSAAPGSLAIIDGYLKSLALGDFAGQVHIGEGLGSASIRSMTDALLGIGWNAGSIAIAGIMMDSIISVGTVVGADGVYNTSDDAVTGGTVKSVTIRGIMRDSAVVAGVLPTVLAGPGVPSDLRLYVGHFQTLDLTTFDSAEAGGLVPSSIGRLQVRGNLLNTDPASGQLNVVAAETIGKVKLNKVGSVLTTREYTDPFGAPTLIAASMLTGSNIELVFSEPLSTGSLVVSQDNDGDGSVAGPVDALGSILLTNEASDVLGDVFVSYTTMIDADGSVRGVVRLQREAGFGDGYIEVTLSGDITGMPITDRSGLRSVLRNANLDGVADPNEDFARTILDGGGDGYEGGDTVVYLRAGDSADYHGDENVSVLTFGVDGSPLRVFGTLTSGQDVDLFEFSGEQYDFFSVEVSTAASLNFGVFWLDDQGTPDDISDDFVEILARYESNVWGDADVLYGAYELPETGTYYVILAYSGGASAGYELDMRMASSDDMLDGVADGRFSAPDGEDIAYVSNFIGEHNNLLGANEPRQLVYLDFDGGHTTEYDPGFNIPVEAFDASLVDPTLVGETEVLIEGDGGEVTGIVDNMMQIFTNVPANYQFDVGRISTLAEWQAITEGLYFTTVDPAMWGLDPSEDFTTVFIGSANAWPFGGGLYGIASDIDVANMHKGDNALVFVEPFAHITLATDRTQRLNEFAITLASVAAHELGHTLGLNHQPTDRWLNVWVDRVGQTQSWLLENDDPDNAGPETDSNTGVGLMAYAPDDEMISALAELGTDWITSREFLYGHIDTADLLHRWLS